MKPLDYLEKDISFWIAINIFVESTWIYSYCSVSVYVFVELKLFPCGFVRDVTYFYFVFLVNSDWLFSFMIMYGA